MRVLIVEDEPFIAFEIEAIVLDRLPNARIVLASSIGDAFAAVGDDVDLAFLDIDVTDGKTYPLALELKLRKIPFVFVSAASRCERPTELSDAGFIPKPFAPCDIEKAIDDFAAARQISRGA